MDSKSFYKVCLKKKQNRHSDNTKVGFFNTKSNQQLLCSWYNRFDGSDFIHVYGGPSDGNWSTHFAALHISLLRTFLFLPLRIIVYGHRESLSWPWWEGKSYITHPPHRFRSLFFSRPTENNILQLSAVRVNTFTSYFHY